MFADNFDSKILKQVTLANTGAFSSFGFDNKKQVGMVIYDKEESYLKDKEFIDFIIDLMNDYGAIDRDSKLFVNGDKEEWMIDKNYFGKDYRSINQVIFMKKTEIVEIIDLDNFYENFLN